MTTALPLRDLLRSTLRTSMNPVTEGSRRNARDAISARAVDAAAAGQLLAGLAPAEPATAPITHGRTA